MEGSMNTSTDGAEFIGLYVIPGEGTVAALRVRGETELFDKQGLEWIIVEKRKAGADSSVEEQALAQVKQNENSSNGYY